MADKRIFQLGTLVSGVYKVTLIAEGAAGIVTLDNCSLEVEATAGSGKTCARRYHKKA